MKLSDNNFDKDHPTKATGFATAVPSAGGAFASAQPTKGGGSFATSLPASVNGLVSSKPSQSLEIMSGDDTSGGAYGGDFETFGEIYGQDNYGGIVHFKNRPTPPVINH